MGTNYYLRPPGACQQHCDRWIHLGKSSMGWAFTFQATTTVTNFAEWVAQLNQGEIYDEYGARVMPAALLKLIENKRNGLSDPHGIGYYDADGNLFVRVGFS